MPKIELIQGNCLEKMEGLGDNSIDAVVTDPPYELGFMGKKWDNTGIAYRVELWLECLRVLKPGGYLISFGGTRTYHRMAVAIEDAGFEVRDMIEWCYGSGFPKSLNIGKSVNQLETKGHTEWEGWGTALKPAHEPICFARKPLVEKTVAENVLKYGTGGINIDESRVGTGGDYTVHNAGVSGSESYQWNKGEQKESSKEYKETNGRFPANLIHDNSDEVRECFPETGKSTGGRIGNKGSALNMMGQNYEAGDPGYGDSGNASRFFKSIIYTAKASKSERNKGCEELEEHKIVTFATANGTSNKASSISEGRNTVYKNNHPTVKPIALMEYLIKMVTPQGGVVLDPFMGSGTTGVACKNLNRDFIGIELDPEYSKIAEKRINVKVCDDSTTETKSIRPDGRKTD